MNAIALIKADDLYIDSNLEMWGRFIALNSKYKAHVDVGFISTPNTESSTSYQALSEWVSRIQKDHKISFFDHGVKHERTEFTSLENAVKSFNASASVTKKLFGTTLDGFGAPYNEFGECSIIEWNYRNPRGYVYYPELCSERKLEGKQIEFGPRYISHAYHISFERADRQHNPVFDYFRKSFKEKIESAQPLVLQVHPARWSEEGFMAYEEILNHLLGSGYRFVTPSDFMAVTIPGSSTLHKKVEFNSNGDNAEDGVIPHYNLRLSNSRCTCDSDSSYEGYIETLQHILDINHDGFKRSRPMVEKPAALAIDGFKKFSDFEDLLKKSQKGNWLRLAKKAAGLKYYCEPFNRRTFIPDIYEINTSLDARGAGSMPASYRRSISELGGAPNIYRKFVKPACELHWDIWFGVFKDAPGYKQGDVVVDKKLFGYVHLRRMGELIIYAMFLGHGERLGDGIMNYAHQEIGRWILDGKDGLTSGAKTLMYGAMNHGGLGRQDWKKRAGFSESLISIGSPMALAKPASPKLPLPLIESSVDRKYVTPWLDLMGEKVEAIPSITYLWECAQEYVISGNAKEIRRYEGLIYFLHNSKVSPYTKLGKSVKFGYGGIGVVLHEKCRIGDYVSIGQNVTVGGTPGKMAISESGDRFLVPIVHDHAYIAAGSKIIGPVIIGELSIIGANSVVNSNVPARTVWGGNPARQIAKIDKKNCLKYKSLFHYFKSLSDEEFLSHF